MVFETRNESQFYTIPKAPGSTNVQFADVYTSKTGISETNSLTASCFVIKKSDVAGDAIPKYENEETGIVLKGTLNITDETGKKSTITSGGTFFVHRGSTMSFSTDDFAVCYKVANRPKIFSDVN
ncbi:hypothetical protein DL95DRAFT_389526 [Leptodontidium sp. 2 PMI_412]|nr:ethanolamine utilization protein [Leptodontidium sp. MPI-SDFR-AT-0119]KAH9214551.1 hypothetical protein DL95DRAFT_389526 [Leptodontidium sp. 2 PMI_412]